MTRRKWVGPAIGFLVFAGVAYVGSSAQCGLYLLPADAQLLRACRTGDAALARNALRWGANPNAHRLLVHEVPLAAAASVGNTEVVRELARAGAHLDTCCGWPHCAPPLVYAARLGHLETVRALLDAGADVNARTCEHQTALDEAKQYNHPDVVKLLRQRGAQQ